MVTLATVEEQLKVIGCNFRFWNRAEMRELCNILLPGETIAQAVGGQYEGGFALLCATDFRVLLIDKKPKYLTLKDIRFDMITELDFSGRMMNSTVSIYTPNKELRFTAINNIRLRKLYTHTQHKVMEIRHHFMMQQFQQAHELKNTPPGVIMSQAMQNPALPAHSSYQSPAPPQNPPQYQQDSFYNPEPTDEHKRLAAAMGNAGLRSIVHNGQVIKEYMTVPFAQRWRKRPYGFSRDALPQGTQQR
jgi:hypothetical protein